MRDLLLGTLEPREQGHRVKRMTWSRMSSYAALVVVAIVVMGVISATQQATETPKHAYILVQADISNPERYAEYAKLAPDIGRSTEGATWPAPAAP